MTRFDLTPPLAGIICHVFCGGILPPDWTTTGTPLARAKVATVAGQNDDPGESTGVTGSGSAPIRSTRGIVTR